MLKSSILAQDLSQEVTYNLLQNKLLLTSSMQARYWKQQHQFLSSSTPIPVITKIIH